MTNLVGKMWPGLVAWARESMLSLDPPLANERDMEIPHCVANADEAIAVVRKHHQAWLSAQRRFSGGSDSLEATTTR